MLISVPEKRHDGYDVVLLNDIFTPPLKVDGGHARHKWSFWSRYLGPYTVKSSIMAADPTLSVIVVDYFTKIPDFFEYIRCFIGPGTRYIGLSVTFLQLGLGSGKNVNEFNLWHDDHDATVAWFARLMGIAPNAEIMIGGHACDTYFKHYVKSSKPKPLPRAMRDYVSYVFHGYSESIISDFFRGTVRPEHRYVRDGVVFLSDDSKAGKDARCLSVAWGKDDAIEQGEWLPLEISKGCRFSCKFCMFDRQGTTVKSEEVLRAELIRNFELFGTKGYSLTDDTVNDSIDKVRMLHRVATSLPFKIEWIGYARPDMFHAYPEMLDLMIESGCKGMFLGIETLDPTAAKIIGKGLHPDHIKQILSWIKQKAGRDVFVLASFIIGLIGETEQSLSDTLEWLATQDVIDKITYEVLYVRDQGYRTETRDDFSSNGDRFGFKQLTFHPEYYWEHDTLDYRRCKVIAEQWRARLSENRHTGSDMAIEGFTNFWSYPRMRSLGYSHDESFDMLRLSAMSDELYDLNDRWIERYHRSLAERSLAHGD